MATETTLTSAKAWAPDITAVAPQDAVPDALVLLTSTIAGNVEGDAPVVRVQYVDDAAAAFVAEGTAISEADPNLAEVLVHTGKIAQLIRLSREQMSQPNARTLLSRSVARAVTRAANIAYLTQPHPGSTTQVITINGSPSGGTFTLSGNGNTTGTINYNAAAATVQTAIQTLAGPYAAATVTGSAGGPYTVTIAAVASTLTGNGSALTGGTSPSVTVAATGSSSGTPAAGLFNVPGIVDGGAVTANLDKIIDLQALIAANDGMPTHIVLSPTAWASLRKFKGGATTSENVSLLGAGTEDVIPSLLNLPVIVSNAVPAGSGLMLDRNAIVSAVGPVMVATSDEVYFNSDSVGVRCTWRFGQNVVHPNRIGRFTI